MPFHIYFDFVSTIYSMSENSNNNHIAKNKEEISLKTLTFN